MLNKISISGLQIMDAIFIKGLVDDIVRLNIELHDMKRELNDMRRECNEQKKTIAELTEKLTHERGVLAGYYEEAKKSIEQTGLCIDSMIETAAANVEPTSEESVNSVEQPAATEVVVDELEKKRAKRREYMKRYMEKKRNKKEVEETSPCGLRADC